MVIMMGIGIVFLILYIIFLFIKNLNVFLENDNFYHPSIKDLLRLYKEKEGKNFPQYFFDSYSRTNFVGLLLGPITFIVFTCLYLRRNLNKIHCTREEFWRRIDAE